MVVDEVFVRARAGDATAFADLVSEHGAEVLRLCTVITADRGLAEDAAQNAWHRAWRGLATVRDPSALRAWLLRVAANEAKQIVRRNRRHRLVGLGDVTAIQPTPPDEDVRLTDALRLLNPAERELLGRRYALGFTSEEIGGQIGLSAKGVRTRLKRIRDRLRKELERSE